MKPTRGLTACLITLNSGYWLPKTFPQVVANSDKVIVIDGDHNGPSTDRTLEILFDLKRPGDIIWRGKIGQPGNDYNWDLIKREMYLRMVDTSHMLLIDDDEAYLPEDWQRFHNYVDHDITCVTFPYVHFYIDMRHRLRGGYWDAPCHHFTRFDPSYRYTDISTVLKRSDGLAVATDAIHDDRIRLYHYNRVSPRMVYKEKQEKFLPRWDGGSLSNEQIGHWQAAWEDDRNLDCSTLSDGVWIESYDGPHPLEGTL